VRSICATTMLVTTTDRLLAATGKVGEEPTDGWPHLIHLNQERVMPVR